MEESEEYFEKPQSSVQISFTNMQAEGLLSQKSKVLSFSLLLFSAE